MAHELALKADGKHAMAFVGQTPWHGLGQALTIGAPIETWINEAGFNWSAQVAPVTYTDSQGRARNFEDKKILFRDDNGAPLSVVGDGYQIVQPREVIEFFRDLTEREDWHLHTAGVLRDGRRLWAMASRGEAADIVRGDRVTENLLLATSLDGSLATVAGLTAVRVVCANTLKLSLRDGLTSKNGTKAARVSHRSAFDPQAIKRAIGVAGETFAAHVDAARTLAERQCSLEEARDVLRTIFGQPIVKSRETAPTIADARFQSMMAKIAAPMVDVREQKSVARVLELFAGEGRGADLAGVKGTRWGLLNAITEHVDHEQGRDGTRLEAAWFGRGDDFKSQALELLTA